MKQQALILASALAITACATSPDYREARNDRAEGFSEQVIETNRYRIQYRMDDDHVGRAQDYALLRAAELTMEKGYETFEVVGETTDVGSRRSSGSSVGIERTTLVTRDCGLLGCTTTAQPVYGTNASFGTDYDAEETVVTVEIIMSNLDPSASVRHYDASQVAANIRARL